MTKYQQFPSVELDKRDWPNNKIETAPVWCSVDLRDGNQALIEPMGADKKIRLFKTLVDMGYKEIEVGFPSASQTDFDFTRELIENGHIPDDVTIQVLVQARRELIERTCEALAGVKNAIIHVYNSTSTLQRNVVFKMDMEGIKEIAVNGAKMVKDLSQGLIESGSNIRYQYSPESFTQTELPYALEVCEAVLDTFGATKENPVIINLPATVEVASPNVHADQIEWMHKNFSNRERLILSLHPHNDRGTGVAATELALMAGADRVEGTLFGNGERTGNVCLVTLGLNMHTQGVDAKIDFSNLDEIVKVCEYCTQLPVHERHPYAGKLVYTAFSGSHQDAINKGMKALKEQNSDTWNVPYLPIDPRDVGRDYEAIIRINSQSGKGGIAYIMEADYGIKIPKKMQASFSQVVQKNSDKSGQEQSSKDIYEQFKATYLENVSPFEYISHESRVDTHSSEKRVINAKIKENGTEVNIEGVGTGPIDAFVKAMCEKSGNHLVVQDYSEHAVSSGDEAVAIAYIEVADDNGKSFFGSAMDKNITSASLKAIISAFNNAK
ncbi:MAG: 2-isopropylmalate synthase [Alphaproteobacteria bacterium]